MLNSLITYQEKKLFFKSLKDPKIILYSMVPIFLGIILEIIIIIATVSFIIYSIAEFDYESITDAIALAIKIASSGVIIYLLIISFYAIILAVGSPFYDLISERIDQLDGKKKAELSLIVSIKAGLKFSLGYLVITISIAIVNFVASIIPVIGNTLSMVYSFTIGAVGLSFGILVIVYARKNIGFFESIRIGKKWFKDLLLLGVAMKLAAYIPVINVLLFPAFIIWGSIIAIRILEKEKVIIE